jgi:GNAT superfamily N-acetyltransferase
MVGELKPIHLDPAIADAEAWRAFHVLRRMREQERRPDDPIQPDGEVEARMKKPNPFEQQYWYLIRSNDHPVSLFSAETVLPANAEYETNRHLLWADVFVRPDARRRGIASRWLPVIVEVMERHGCTVVGFFAENDAAHGFLKWLGAGPKLNDIESRLKMSDVDWAMVERWMKEGADRSPETKLEIYDGPLPDGILPDFATQITSMLNTMPMEDLDIGKIIITPERIKDWNARQALVGELPHTLLTREPDGIISGITDVTWAPYRRTLVHQQFTGVRPDARGRGLGKWLKAAMLLHLREIYPDVEWIVTDNAHSNGPMLKINRTLGFKAYRTGVEYQIGRDDLQARLRPASV